MNVELISGDDYTPQLTPAARALLNALAKDPINAPLGQLSSHIRQLNQAGMLHPTALEVLSRDLLIITKNLPGADLDKITAAAKSYDSLAAEVEQHVFGSTVN